MTASGVARRLAAPLAVMLALAAPRVRAQGASHDDVLREPSIVWRAPLDTSAVVNFRVLAQPETLYVGQQATYQLGVFLDETVRDRLRRMEALAPEMRSMMAYDPPAPAAGFPMRTAGAHRYEAHVYQRPIFPLSAGRFAIPPARLVYAMPLSYSFFSREESFELRSDSAIIVAIDPPAASRPGDYAGAVGVLRASARVDTAAARVGDAVRLTVRVSGEGNVKLFPRPLLAVDRASVVRAGERVTLSADSLVVHGTKEFDWVVTPLRAGRLVIPPIRYPYFDPYERRYEVALTEPETLSIAPGTLARLDTGTAAVQPRWSVRTSYRGALPVPVHHRPGFLFAMLLVPLPAVALLVAHRPRRPRRAPSRALALRALTRRRATPAASEVRRAYLGAIAERVRLSATAIAEPAALVRALRRAGTSSSTAQQAAALLVELDVAAFGVDAPAVPDAAQRAYTLFRAIDVESRTFRVPAGAALVLVALVTAASAWGSAPDADAARFARAVDDYQQGRYAASAHLFEALARSAPRAADAWANFGTAAFAAADTASAAIGWQRALRLEPLAADVRDRLDVVAPASGLAPGAVPVVPPAPIAIAAAALWCFGWLVLAWRVRRGRARAGAVFPCAIAGAVALAAVAVLVDGRLGVRDLVVVRRESSLRLLPALAAERGAAVHIGEVARVLQRDGPWAHIAEERDRDGWIASEDLLPLSD